MYFNVESAVERYQQFNAMPKPGANIGPMLRKVI
jgi:hypothetical protein